MGEEKYTNTKKGLERLEKKVFRGTLMFLEQRSANFFSKGQESKYFRLFCPYVCSTTQLCYCSAIAAIENTQMNGRG